MQFAANIIADWIMLRQCMYLNHSIPTEEVSHETYLVLQVSCMEVT